MSLAERALKLNPHYPDWYNQGLSLVFFFGEQYDRSVKYRLLVKEPVALDYAFLAMAYAYLGSTGDAEMAAANVKKLDPTWIAERYLSEAGGYSEKEAELFVNGARKAGLPDCVPADKLKGDAQSDPRQVLRPATRQGNWVIGAWARPSYCCLLQAREN